MASFVASWTVVAPTCGPVEKLSKSFSGLKTSTAVFSKVANPLSVSNGSRLSAVIVVSPNSKKFETPSYLPTLTKEQVAKQVEFLLKLDLIPCIEFDRRGTVYREYFHGSGSGSGHCDGRSWAKWKLPMFGCQDSATVLREIDECAKQYPQDHIRVLGFSAKRQVQICGFLAHEPEAVAAAA